MGTCIPSRHYCIHLCDGGGRGGRVTIVVSVSNRWWSHEIDQLTRDGTVACVRCVRVQSSGSSNVRVRETISSSAQQPETYCNTNDSTRTTKEEGAMISTSLAYSICNVLFRLSSAHWQTVRSRWKKSRRSQRDHTLPPGDQTEEQISHPKRLTLLFLLVHIIVLCLRKNYNNKVT